MKTIHNLKIAIILLLVSTQPIQAQTPISTEFTYQGELTFNDQVADGLYDFEVSLHDALVNGNPSGSTMNIEAIEVNNGIFTLSLYFGDAAFVGNEVYLEIHVRENNSGQSYNELSPRQKINNTPYAVHAQYVGVDAVTGDEILDGSIRAQDLGTNSVNSVKLYYETVVTLLLHITMTPMIHSKLMLVLMPVA